MDFNTALENILNKMNAHMRKYYLDSVDVFGDEVDEWIERSTYRTQEGRKYIKITREGSVVAFVEKETGNIFKPASWQAPAKGVRGNIFSDKKGMEALNFDSVGLVFVKYAANYAKS